jgi:hypothetical protein
MIDASIALPNKQYNVPTLKAITPMTIVLSHMQVSE